MLLSLLLFAHAALSAEPSPPAGVATEPRAPTLLVRIDDRATRSLQAPGVTVLYPDGRRLLGRALDDGSDPDDRFAGDHLWVARLASGGEGRVWVMVSDGGTAEAAGTLARQAVVLSASGGQTTIRYSRPEAGPSSTGAMPISDQEAATSAGDEGAAATEPGQIDALSAAHDDGAFPISNAAALSAGQPSFSVWSRNARMALVAFVVTFALVVGWVTYGLKQLAQRLSALERPARPAPPEGALEEEDRGDPGQRPPHRPWWLDATLVGLTAVLVGAVWLPVLPLLRRDFLGVEYVDHYGTQWFYWFVEYNLRNGLSPASTDLFFFPWGKDIYKHTGANVLDAYMAIPFRMLFGPILGYNIFILSFHALSGWAFYRLAREISEDRLACAVSACLFTLQPYILLEFMEGRPTQGITILPVLFFWALFVSGKRRGWMAPVAGGVLLALSGYMYWFYALFGGMAALAHGLWRSAFPVEGAGGRWRTFFRHVVIAAVAMGISLPVALPMVIATTGDVDVPGLLDTDKWTLLSASPITREGIRIGVFSWQPLRAAMGFLVVDANGNERFLAQYVAVPWVLLVATLIWLRRPGRLDRGVVLAMLAVLILMAAGPVLLIGSTALPNIPYVLLVKSVGFLRRLWWPSRSLAFVTIVLSLVLVAALSWLRRQNPRFQLAGFVGLIGWWAVDLREVGTLPFPSWDGTVPAGYRCLAGAGKGAIIELPYAWTQAHLYFQTYHGRPMLGGMLEDNPVFTPEEFTDFRTHNPMVSHLIFGDPIGLPFDWDRKAADEVYALGYRYVVVQKDAFYHPEDEEGPGRLQVLLSSLDNAIGDPIYDDGRLAIYAPWGDALPCDLTRLRQDPAPTGPTEVKQEVREMDPAKQIFQRWPEPDTSEAPTGS